MENEVVSLIKVELENIDIAVAIDNICKKKELVAVMVGYILAEQKL